MRRTRLEAGIAAERVLSELFHTSSTGVDTSGRDLVSRVSVTLDGAETSFELPGGETVLDGALREGVDAPYSCAGGACGTCRAKVVLGAATMDQNHALDPHEVADGYVLTCQARPTSEELRVDYDA